MTECNFYEAHNIYLNLNEQQFRLNKINEIKSALMKLLSAMKLLITV